MGWKRIEEIVDRALAEDVGWGDVTTEALVPAELTGRASFVAKAHGILAGVEVARLVFHRVDPAVQFDITITDGNSIQPGDAVAVVEGKVASILKAERTALNFLQRLSGIATETNRYVEVVKGLGSRIVDTRKTTPGLRILEKYAVRVGGGHNHRLNLGDGVLIKDNHLAALRSRGLAMKDIISRARERAPFNLKVEVEVRTAQEAVEAVEVGADIVMLDNMGLEEMRQAVLLVKGRALIEASGGITLDNVRRVAETGVDLISIGALTHSVRSLDISLEM
ncbi:MAG: carboxylating nicotinate-nucleotide diphosphorylase [Chloroflexi bacterium]|nr:carboxylating nicotinate-nucleotide diphosphorylase [Chloroflexota bacterium]